MNNKKMALATWRRFVRKCGESEARRKLRAMRRGYAYVVSPRARTDALALLQRMIHGGMHGSPCECRKRLADAIRLAIQREREKRGLAHG